MRDFIDQIEEREEKRRERKTKWVRETTKVKLENQRKREIKDR